MAFTEHILFLLLLTAQNCAANGDENVSQPSSSKFVIGWGVFLMFSGMAFLVRSFESESKVKKDLNKAEEEFGEFTSSDQASYEGKDLLELAPKAKDISGKGQGAKDLTETVQELKTWLAIAGATFLCCAFFIFGMAASR